MTSSLIFIVILPVVLSQDLWSLTGVTGPGPDEWAETFPLCNGSRLNARQTPIDVSPADTIYNDALTPFQFNGYDNLEYGDVNITHNGYSGGGSLKPDVVGKVNFTGGGYVGTYILACFHMHWGVSDRFGSDHSFGGKFYSASIHMGHFNAKYGSMENAVGYEDGVAALAFFFKKSGQDNTDLDPYIEALQNIPNKGDSIVLNSGLDKLMSSDMTRFYRYKGSMPIPPCLENAIWTLFKTPNTISSAQLAKIRTSLYDPEPPTIISENRRPIQPLNGRIMERNFQDDDDDENDDEQ